MLTDWDRNALIRRTRQAADVEASSETQWSQCDGEETAIEPDYGRSRALKYTKLKRDIIAANGWNVRQRCGVAGDARATMPVHEPPSYAGGGRAGGYGGQHTQWRGKRDE